LGTKVGVKGKRVKVLHSRGEGGSHPKQKPNELTRSAKKKTMSQWLMGKR